MTLLETMVAAAVLILGIGVVASTVISIVRLNRRNLAQAQAYTLAEWYLERVTRMGCPGSPPDCSSIQALDNKAFSFYWNENGVPALIADRTTAKEPPRIFDVTVDVDPPFEKNETGDPAVNRTIGVKDTQNNYVDLVKTLNVRVTVSWKDELSRTDYNAVALQTRVSP